MCLWGSLEGLLHSSHCGMDIGLVWSALFSFVTVITFILCSTDILPCVLVPLPAIVLELFASLPPAQHNLSLLLGLCRCYTCKTTLKQTKKKAITAGKPVHGSACPFLTFHTTPFALLPHYCTLLHTAFPFFHPSKHIPHTGTCPPHPAPCTLFPIPHLALPPSFLPPHIPAPSTLQTEAGMKRKDCLTWLTAD